MGDLVIYKNNKEEPSDVGVVIQGPTNTPNGDTVHVAWKSKILPAYVWSLEIVDANAYDQVRSSQNWGVSRH